MEFILNFNSWYKGLPPSGKMSLLVVILGAIIAGVVVTSEYKYAGYQYLYTNLSLTDANQVAERLQSMGVEAQLRGDAVLVPGNRVLELRNQLAAEGLPTGGGVGFEIFDKQNFGETEFQQRINYIRAIQGELARTIMAIDGVEKARVHIVIPEPSLFSQDQRQPTASVAMNMAKGRKLSDGQIRGILHMIVTSVEGLSDAHVNIIDQNGNVLYRGASDETAMSAKGMEIQSGLEQRLERQVAEMLEKIVGPGGVSVKVSANLNLAQVERTVESVDPESRVALSENVTTEQSSGSAGTSGGTPGAAANLPGGGGASTAGGSSETSKRTETSSTYTVSKTTQKILEPVGTIKSISVAVLVDGNYTAQEDGTQKYDPRAAEDLKKFEDLVKQAVGYDENRGDRVKVENLQFKRFDATDVDQEKFVQATNATRWNLFLMDHGKTVGLVVVLGIIFILLVRLVNSYAPPITLAYANVIGQEAGQLAGALPAKAAINIIRRDSPEAKDKASMMANQIPEVNQRRGAAGEINFVESNASITIEAPTTSEEKLRLQAAKMQTEELIRSNSNEAVSVIRAWMNEG